MTPDYGKCRFCKTPLFTSMVDLGMSPLANAYIRPERFRGAETFFPLHALVCDQCFLVQVGEFERPEVIFTDYAYFSSYSQTWLEHSRAYTEKMIQRFGIDSKKLVVEVASNDGYLLQYFKERNIPVLGIEPAGNVADIAINKRNIPTWVKFFGEKTALELQEQNKKADLLLGNNVLAHVPDLNDFVKGLKMALKDDGVLTMEFPHLLNLIEQNQFDTIYQEHFSYFSLQSVEKIFRAHGMEIFDVEELPTHGGSLRIYAHHVNDKTKRLETTVLELKEKEKKAGLFDLKTYAKFKNKVHETKRKLLTFLIEAKKQNKTIIGYGAPAKGNTLLNYCGIRSDFLDYVVDVSPAKIGCLLPGTHIRIEHPDKLKETKPDYVLILPWNFKDEIISKSPFVRSWGGKFVVPIPEVRVID